MMGTTGSRVRYHPMYCLRCALPSPCPASCPPAPPAHAYSPPPPPLRGVGRVDDVINVSGHRIGTAEVESALVSHPKCAEAAVVPGE